MITATRLTAQGRTRGAVAQGEHPARDYTRPVQEQVKQTQGCALRIMLQSVKPPLSIVKEARSRLGGTEGEKLGELEGASSIVQ